MYVDPKFVDTIPTSLVHRELRMESYTPLLLARTWQENPSTTVCISKGHYGVVVQSAHHATLDRSWCIQVYEPVFGYNVGDIQGLRFQQR